jgi:hypothetical protein
MPPSWDVGLPRPMIFQVAKGVYPVGEPEPRWRDRGDEARGPSTADDFSSGKGGVLCRGTRAALT